MSIYGEIVSENQTATEPYEPRQVSSVDVRPLTRAVDPSNAADPTLLGRQLLSLISDAPPLALVIRLMLCLKPSNDDWDNPAFPYLFTDLLDCAGDFDLEMAFNYTSKPIADDTPLDLIRRFSEQVAASIGPKVSILYYSITLWALTPFLQSNDQSFLVAGILCQVAPQHPDMARVLMVRCSHILRLQSDN